MNIKSMVAHLMLNLPKHTAEFSEIVAITSASVVSSRYVDVVATAHGLTVGKIVLAQKGDVRNYIDSIVIESNIAIITLKDEHDFNLSPEKMEIELCGFTESSWNGKHELINVPSRLMLEIVSPGSSVPDLTTSYVWESRRMGANGLLEVVQLNSDGFRIAIPENHPDMPNNELRNLEIISGFRMCGVADENRSIDVWNETDKTKSWLHVMFPDDAVSKSIEAESEAVATFGSGDDGRLRILENIEISVFIPVVKTGGADAVFKANGEIRKALISALYGFRDEEPGRDRSYPAIYNGSTQSIYNTAVYIRVYSFQIPYDITFENADVSNPESVAFRNVLLKMAISENKDATRFETKINLDSI